MVDTTNEAIVSDDAPRWALDMAQTLGRVEGAVNNLQDNFHRQVATTDDVEERLGAVERRQAASRASARAWAAAGTLLGSLAGYFGGHHS